jgi:hypothetical protein
VEGKGFKKYELFVEHSITIQQFKKYKQYKNSLIFFGKREFMQERNYYYYPIRLTKGNIKALTLAKIDYAQLFSQHSIHYKTVILNVNSRGAEVLLFRVEGTSCLLNLYRNINTILNCLVDHVCCYYVRLTATLRQFQGVS